MWKRLCVNTAGAVLLACSMMASQAVADDNDDDRNGGDENMVELQPILVTATRSERDLREVPMSVGLVGQEEIRRNPALNVSDMLSNIPGAFASGGNQAGNRKISLRGMGTEHTLILIDGVRQHGFMDTYGASITIDPANIERIEVIKGPASVLYGSDAIGGVVNIITKKGLDSNASLRFSTRLIIDSSTESFEPQASISGLVNGFDYRVSGSGINADSRKTPRGTLPYSDYSHRDYAAELGYSWEGGRLAFSYEDFRREAALTPLDWSRDNAPFMDTSDITTYSLTPRDDRKTFRGGLTLDDLTDNLNRLSLTAYSQKADLVTTPMDNLAGTRTGRNSSHYDSFGGSLQTEWEFGETHQLTLGFDYDKIDFEDRRANYTLALPGLNYRATGHQETSALFLQDEWKLTEDFTAIFGLRQNWSENKLTKQTSFPDRVRTVKESKLVGSVGATYSGFDNFAFRAQFSQGFKTPTPLQLLTGSGYLQPNPDLKPEESNNYEIGLRYMGEHLNVDVSLYYNDLKDGITYVSIPGGTQYQNFDTKDVYGLELSADYHIPETGFTPYAALNAMRVITERDGFKTMHNDRPSLTGKLGLKWESPINDNQLFFIDANSIMASRSFQETRNSATGLVSKSAIRPAWQTANLTLGLEGEAESFKYNATLSLKNICDQDYIPVNAFIPDPGFHIIAAFGVEF